MANFESGVGSYIRTQATVYVNFPVDHKGNADISCAQCFYFKEYSKRCGLNGEICAYPNKYVGDACPLSPVVDEETGEVDV